MDWTVYVLRSKAGTETYVGITHDLDRRLRQHNGELPGGARTTHRGRPWSVATTYGPFSSRGEAQSAEASVKRLRGAERLSWTPPEGVGSRAPDPADEPAAE